MIEDGGSENDSMPSCSLSSMSKLSEVGEYEQRDTADWRDDADDRDCDGNRKSAFQFIQQFGWKLAN